MPGDKRAVKDPRVRGFGSGFGRQNVGVGWLLTILILLLGAACAGRDREPEIELLAERSPSRASTTAEALSSRAASTQSGSTTDGEVVSEFVEVRW